MPVEATVYRVLIASPSDVQEEREAAREVVIEWNGTHSEERDVYLEPVMWETHVAPDLGENPQEIINEQIVNQCDLAIGMFWKRIGTETENEPGGAVEELKRISNDKEAHAIVGFSQKSFSRNEYDPEQLEKVKMFEQECEQNGLTFTYNSVDEFRYLLSKHLSNTMNQILSKDSNSETFRKQTEEGDSFYDIGVDKERLEKQANMHLDCDRRNIEKIVKHFEKSGVNKPYRVLDAGCGYGNVTKKVFGNDDRFDVLAFDISEEAIEIAKNEYGAGNIRYKTMNVYNIPNKCLEEFDLVFCAFLLHHLKDKEPVMSYLWDLVSEDGGAYLIRSVDDGYHMHYPPDEDVDFLVEVSDEMKGSEDRTHGRRLYTQLKRRTPLPEKIETDFKIHDIVGLNSAEREEYFEVMYSHRLMPAKNLAESEDATEGDKRLYKKMREKMEVSREKFLSNEHFFDVKVVPIVVAYK